MKKQLVQFFRQLKDFFILKDPLSAKELGTSLAELNNAAKEADNRRGKKISEILENSKCF